MARKTLTLKKKLWLWEHTKALGISKTCPICHRRITRFEDMELDHKRAYSRGGTTQTMVHRDCNRMKSSGRIREIQRTLGIKDTGFETRKIKLKALLKRVKIKKLKGVCDELGIKRQSSRRSEGFFFDERRAPSKSSYINRIIKSDIEIDRIKRAIR